MPRTMLIAAAAALIGFVAGYLQSCVMWRYRLREAGYVMLCYNVKQFGGTPAQTVYRLERIRTE